MKRLATRLSNERKNGLLSDLKNPCFKSHRYQRIEPTFLKLRLKITKSTSIPIELDSYAIELQIDGKHALKRSYIYIYTVRHKLSIAYLIFGSISPKANKSFFACIRLKINLTVINSLRQHEN